MNTGYLNFPVMGTYAMCKCKTFSSLHREKFKLFLFAYIFFSIFDLKIFDEENLMSMIFFSFSGCAISIWVATLSFKHHL